MEVRARGLATFADRLLMDGWVKMASILLTEAWPRFRRLRKLRDEEIEQLLHHRSSSGTLRILDEILTAFQGKGSMFSTQLKMGEADVGKWGHRNLSGAASRPLNVRLGSVWRVPLIDRER